MYENKQTNILEFRIKFNREFIGTDKSVVGNKNLESSIYRKNTLNYNWHRKLHNFELEFRHISCQNASVLNGFRDENSLKFNILGY